LAKGEEARSAVEALGIPVSGAGLQGPAVTVSVGCASMQPEAGQTPAYLLAAAEKALVAAKQRGRNRSSA
jgi:PleD family two-component response regulator